MLLEREGFPEEDELVLASVTKVNPSSVFVVLDHYQRRTALIHISEVSPGRIRNIREYVIEGKKVVVKVLRVDKEKGHIDVSLRRVTDIQRRNFSDAIKQEQRSEKLLSQFAEQNKLSQAMIKKEVIDPIHKTYHYVHEFFNDVVEENAEVKEVIAETFAEKLGDFIKERIKPEEVSLKTTFFLQVYVDNGIDVIKKTLKTVEGEDTTITYQGAGKYGMLIKGKEYKGVEKTLQKKLETLEKAMQKSKGTFETEK